MDRKQEKDQELVDQYIRLELSQEEREAFESRLKEDAGLLDLYHTTSMLISGIDNLQEDQIQLSNIVKGLHSADEQSNRIRQLIIWAVAASILLIALIHWRIDSADIQASQYLALDYTSIHGFEEKKRIQSRSIQSTDFPKERAKQFETFVSAVNQALALEDSALIESELNSIQEWVQDSIIKQDVSSYSLILGYAFLQVRSFDQAEDNLVQVTGDGVGKADWLLALCYYHSGRFKEAKQLFQEIANEPFEHDNRAAKAKEILASDTLWPSE